jgi:hypothetical protein
MTGGRGRENIRGKPRPKRASALDPRYGGRTTGEAAQALDRRGPGSKYRMGPGKPPWSRGRGRPEAAVGGGAGNVGGAGVIRKKKRPVPGSTEAGTSAGGT